VTHAIEKWLLPYLAQALKPAPHPPAGKPLTILLAVTDHFEPLGGSSDEERASARLAVWESGLPRLTEGLADAAGNPPRHDFYYPLEEYRPGLLDRLARLREQGLGEVEVHLHHQGESSSQLEDMLSQYAETLYHRHGLLRRDPSGKISYGFIHGNWALDNALPGGRWCGVNDEISILARTGCFADFTLPAAPSQAQTKTINSIYYATDDPQSPRSHEHGIPARRGTPPSGDLLLIQGVLALNWRRRKFALLPSLENSELGWHRPPLAERMKLWLRYAPRLAGAEGYCFIKLHCHGAPEKHHQALLGPPMRRFYENLLERYNDGIHFRLRFVSSWEMAQAVHTLEQGGELEQ
jgi:hypothetical protein